MQTYNDWLLDDFEAADRAAARRPVRAAGRRRRWTSRSPRSHRCVGKGARGFFVPGSPERPYWDPYYDPLWRAVSETGSAVSFHRNHGGRPRADEAPQLDVPGMNVGGIVVRFFSAVTPFTYMIFTGVFERFPDLKVVVGEVNCGWMPFWLENMDQNFQQQRHWAHLPFDRPPSSTSGRNVFVTTLDDHVGFAAMREDPRIADAVMYSIDYPHSVTLWPNSARHIAELTAGMDDATKGQGARRQRRPRLPLDREQLARSVHPRSRGGNAPPGMEFPHASPAAPAHTYGGSMSVTIVLPDDRNHAARRRRRRDPAARRQRRPRRRAVRPRHRGSGESSHRDAQPFRDRGDHRPLRVRARG